MIRLALALAIFVPLFPCVPLYADWYLVQDNQSWEHNTAEKISIDEISFTLGGMKCGVSKPFSSTLGGSTFESRDLYCWVSSDTYVSVRNSCAASETHKPEAMQIKKGTKTYWPSLICRQ